MELLQVLALPGLLAFTGGAALLLRWLTPRRIVALERLIARWWRWAHRPPVIVYLTPPALVVPDAEDADTP